MYMVQNIFLEKKAEKCMANHFQSVYSYGEAESRFITEYCMKYLTETYYGKGTQ